MLRRLSSLRAVGGASRRWCSSAADGGGGSAALTSLQTRMREEFDRLYGTSTAKLPPLPPLPEPEAPPDGERPQKKQFVRRMPDHKLPGYIEGNFRTLQFILTRAPRRDDFPREKLYREDALDLLQRHYYKNTRS